MSVPNFNVLLSFFSSPVVKISRIVAENVNYKILTNCPSRKFKLLLRPFCIEILKCLLYAPKKLFLLQYNFRSRIGPMFLLARKVYEAEHVIVTLPLGVLQYERDLFHPPLPAKVINRVVFQGGGVGGKLPNRLLQTFFW